MFLPRKPWEFLYLILPWFIIGGAPLPKDLLWGTTNKYAQELHPVAPAAVLCHVHWFGEPWIAMCPPFIALGLLKHPFLMSPFVDA